jgi:hypothetical protein
MIFRTEKNRKNPATSDNNGHQQTDAAPLKVPTITEVKKQQTGTIRRGIQVLLRPLPTAFQLYTQVLPPTIGCPDTGSQYPLPCSIGTPYI